MKTFGIPDTTESGNNEFDTSSSEDEPVLPDTTEDEVHLSANSNKMETSSEEIEKGDAVEEKRVNDNQKAQSIFFGQAAPDERVKQKARTIYVKMLTTLIKKEHLQQVFGRYGKIEEIGMFVPKKSFKRNTFALILFENEEDAQKSLEVNGMQYKGDTIVVYKRNRNFKTESVVVTTWKLGMPIDSFLTQMEEAFGLVKQFKFGPSKNCAYVYFESKDSVELALAAGKVHVGGLTLFIHKFEEDYHKRTTIKHDQHQDGINGKGPVEQLIQLNQYQQDLDSSIQIRKNNLDDSVTITINKGGSRGPQLAEKKQHKVKTGFVHKKKIIQAL